MAENNEKTFRYMTLEELANQPLEATEPDVSSPWQLDRKSYTLDYYENGGLLHSVPLLECLNGQGRWEWVDHLCNRGASPFVVGAFAHDLKRYLPELDSPGTGDAQELNT